MVEKVPHKQAVLLLPGFVDFEKVRSLNIINWDDMLLIAVDKGILKAVDIEKPADLWVGDFDSSAAYEVPESHYLQKIPYPEDKDEIDTELAIRFAIEQGATEIILLGGIGGRLDHQMALLFLPLQYPECHFIHTDGEQNLYFIRSEESSLITTRCDSLVSIIAVQELIGLTIKGVKWPLANYHLPLGRGLTYSNRAQAKEVEISLEKGACWCYISAPEYNHSL